MNPSNPPARPIKTAARVFDLVEIVQELQPATFTEIAEQAEMADSTLHDYLTTLDHLGYVSNDDGQYRLSLRLLEHGTAAREQFSIYAKSRTTLKELAAESGGAVWLLVEEDGKAVFLAREFGENAIETRERLGKRENMHVLAAGKVMLAFTSDEHVSEVIERHGLPQLTSESITTPEALDDELATIRDRGYAVNLNESTEGFAAVAAPVVVDDAVQGAIAIAAPAARLQNEAYREQLVGLVTSGANEIELKLVYE